MKRKFFAGIVLVLIMSGSAYAYDWNIDWGAVGDYTRGKWDYVKGMFTPKSKDTTAQKEDEILPESIASGWGKLTDTLTDTLERRDKHESLPGWTWMPFREDKSSNAKKIDALLDKAINILMNGEARDIRREATELRDKTAKMRTELDDLRNKRITAPEKSRLPWKLTRSKADEKIAELEEALQDSTEAMNAITARLSDALKAIGLELDASQTEILLNSVTGDDLLNNAAVFANVKAVVLKLEDLAQNESNSLDITKRYTGMYLVLNDLLIHTQEELIRHIDEDYKPRLTAIITEAESIRKDALTKSNMKDYTLQQRKAFAQNAESNAMTIQVAKLYTELLNSQKAGTLESLKSLRLNRDLAENTYRTVRSSGELRGLIHSGLSAFDAVSSLNMPELKVFESGIMRIEFEEINRRLKK